MSDHTFFAFRNAIHGVVGFVKKRIIFFRSEGVRKYKVSMLIKRSTLRICQTLVIGVFCTQADDTWS